MEGERLAFEMVSDTIGLWRHIACMHDTFVLAAAPNSRTILTRITEFEVRGACRVPKALLLRCTTRRIQRYVLGGFKILAEAA